FAGVYEIERYALPRGRRGLHGAQRSRRVVLAAERFQRVVLEGLCAHRKAIDSGGALLGIEMRVLWIGLDGDFAIGAEIEGAVGGGNDLFDFGAAQQGWCAAAEKETDDLAPAEALRLFCEIRRDCLKQWRVIGA